MSGLGDIPFRRVTLDYLKKALSARLDEPFVGLVTLTSCATDLSSVSPGSLYVPGPGERNDADLHAAIDKGAYAVALPEGLDTQFSTKQLGIPVLFARSIDGKIGDVAAYMEANPSDSLAVFVAFGDNAESVAAKLATLLHILGNPVGLISHDKSYSLNRGMNLDFPLDSVRLQHLQSVALEDGAAALVIAADSQTLGAHALVGTQIDVSAHSDEAQMHDSEQFFGARIDKTTHSVSPGMNAAELARVGSQIPLTDSASAMSFSMALAAGITVESIQQAVKVSEEFS
jgi:UDP-N-acetylmuramyl tripeptide synthase